MKTITYDERVWKLVPMEPTTGMLHAAKAHAADPYIYRAMLKAAPTPLEVEQAQPVVNQQLTAVDQSFVNLTPGTAASTTARPTAQDRGDAEPHEWMTDESRAPWAINSLKARIKEMRASEKRCRNAFRKDYMRVVSVYFADALGEAAGAFEKRLAAIDAARAAKGVDHG